MSRSPFKTIFYLPSATPEQIATYREHLLQEINHSDPPDHFIDPDLIETVALKNGWKIEESERMSAAEGIDRIYYLIVLSLAAADSR